MGGIEGNVENGKVNGEFEIWPGVAGGIIVAALLVAAFNHFIADEDGNEGSHKTEEYTEVTFTPKNSTVECRGLAVGKEIIDSTIVCFYNK